MWILNRLKWRFKQALSPPTRTTRKFTYRLDGLRLTVFDYESSESPDEVYHALKADAYGLRRIDFRAGDVVIDIGGNVGLFSIYLGRKFPSIRIFSFEPIPDSHRHFLMRIEANSAGNITLLDRAVTADGRKMRLVVNFQNSGGATSEVAELRRPGHQLYDVESVTLDGFLASRGIGRVKLLKIDCEGAEYEILRSTRLLPRVEYLSGEFHANGHLRSKGCEVNALLDLVGRHLPRERIGVHTCRMAD